MKGYSGPGYWQKDGDGKWRVNLDSVPLARDWSGLVKRLLDWKGGEKSRDRVRVMNERSG